MNKPRRVLDPVAFFILTRLSLYPAILDAVDASAACIANPLHTKLQFETLSHNASSGVLLFSDGGLVIIVRPVHRGRDSPSATVVFTV